MKENMEKITTDALILLSNVFNEVQHGLEIKKEHLPDHEVLRGLIAKIKSQIREHSRGGRIIHAELDLNFTQAERTAIRSSVELVCINLTDNEFHARVGFSKDEARSIIELFDQQA